MGPPPLFGGLGGLRTTPPLVSVGLSLRPGLFEIIRPNPKRHTRTLPSIRIWKLRSMFRFRFRDAPKVLSEVSLGRFTGGVAGGGSDENDGLIGRCTRIKASLNI